MKQIMKIKLLLDNQAGQLSIFFATNLLVVITFIAMIINVGMFVKAKINLQNAVDAAAWSGAAVQSRQLTNIAYMNWEMRNIYKEWMFKYYILGNLQIPAVETGPTGGTARYLMSSIAGSGGQDSYNFPSVCIEFSTRGGAKICRTYQVPGIPRFGADNITGIDQATQAFVNAIEEQKNLDCARRSSINFMANNLWAYNVVTQNDNAQSIAQASPQIASDRPGAWPSAFEVAVRIRNLEKIVNKKPFTDGVCWQQGVNPKIRCGATISQVQGTARSASNERIVKAFMTGYRNLGVTSDGGNELKRSFTLTELPVTPYTATNAYDLSNLLIPEANREKYYLDLKLMLVNLATFYTSFITPDGATITTSEGNIATSSSCDATKVALPVPGYPLGFTKNPDLVTYYAVKGEAEFWGLFNPFTEAAKLTAYAAAKPFGGRIGPHLFDTMRDNGSTLSSRVSPNNYKSSSYISGLDLSQLRDTRGNPVANTGAYVPGAPIPSNFGGINFWVDDPNAPVGGWLGNPQSIRFGIPNLPYDYVSSATGKEYNSDSPIQVISPGGSAPTAGLYQSSLLNRLRELLDGIGGNVTSDAIAKGIRLVRAPTRYEAFNYLIPTPSKTNEDLRTDSFGEPNMSGHDKIMQFNMFAPLVGDGEDYLYRNTAEILAQAQAYISHQKPAIDKYKASMNLVAQKVGSVRTETGAVVGGEAARAISDINFSLPPNQIVNETPTCASMTGNFVYFYLGPQESGIASGTQCPRPLKDSLELYWSEKSGTIEKDFYSIQYEINDNYESIKKDLFSAYRVSDLQGGRDGNLVNRINNTSENMIRNFYSTKLVHLRSLSNSSDGHYNENSSQFPTVSEGNSRASGATGTIRQQSFKNPLNLESIGISPSDIDQ